MTTITLDTLTPTGTLEALVDRDGDGTLAVAAVLGMRWPVGKLVSTPSLRGQRPLPKEGASCP